MTAQSLLIVVAFLLVGEVVFLFTWGTVFPDSYRRFRARVMDTYTGNLAEKLSMIPLAILDDMGAVLDKMASAYKSLLRRILRGNRLVHSVKEIESDAQRRPFRLMLEAADFLGKRAPLPAILRPDYVANLHSMSDEDRIPRWRRRLILTREIAYLVLLCASTLPGIRRLRWEGLVRLAKGAAWIGAPSCVITGSIDLVLDKTPIFQAIGHSLLVGTLGTLVACGGLWLKEISQAPTTPSDF